MAIQTKKRDRASITMTTTPNFSPSSKASSAPSSCDHEEEYERAVAFLREFHSRRTPATVLHSTSLDAILEADHFDFDEMLAGDFSVALSVGNQRTQRGGMKSKQNATFSQDAAGDRRNGYNSASKSSSLLRRNASSLSSMKKTTTSKCLFDLDGSSSSMGDLTSFTASSRSHLKTMSTRNTFGLRRSPPSSSLLRTVSPAPSDFESSTAVDTSTDFYFGYDEDDSCSLPPMTKRHRGLTLALP